jgi:hypothetical protein
VRKLNNPAVNLDNVRSQHASAAAKSCLQADLERPNTASPRMANTPAEEPNFDSGSDGHPGETATASSLSERDCSHGAPIQENELPYKAYMKLKKSVLFEFQNGTIINLEKNVVFQQLPRGGAAIFWRQTVLALYCNRLS